MFSDSLSWHTNVIFKPKCPTIVEFKSLSTTGEIQNLGNNLSNKKNAMLSQAHHILVPLKQQNEESIIIKVADHKPNQQFHNECS
jgi:hypothetical protein